MSDLNKILKIIDIAPAQFNKQMPEIEKKIFGQISILLKDLKIDSNGKITPTLENLKLISEIKNKLGKIVVSKEYSAAVEKFVANIPQISNYQSAGLNSSDKKLISAVAQQQINSTLENLIGAGYKQEVVNKLHNLLMINVVSGGHYDDLLETLRMQIISNKEGKGILSNYTAQHVNNAIPQLDGYISKMVADIKGYEWFRYGGSNITTTREFCIYMTKKDYFHISEIPTLLTGMIDGHQCKIYEKTGLPYGMVDGTNESNFFVYRGGHYGDQIGCRHRINGVPTDSVPKNLINKHSQKTVEKWADNNLKGGEIASNNLYSGSIEVLKSNMKNAAQHLTGKNKEIVIKTVENIDKWEKYKPNVLLKHPRNDFSAFNYYTLEIENVKYIIHVGISRITGKEIFYTVYDIKKT